MHKETEGLEIFIPSAIDIDPQKYLRDVLLSFLYIMPFTLGLALVISMGKIGTIIKFTIALFVGIFLLVMSLYKDGKRTRIYLDNDQLKLEYESLSFKLKREEHLSNIVGVFLWRSQQNKYMIIIQAEEKNYTIEGGKNGLTKIEAAWLAKEIQDWLYYR